MPASETRGRHPYLTAKDAEELVAQSITVYRAHHRHVPARVVVLKTSRFRPEEAEGIDAALKTFGIEMADLLWVQESSPIAVFREGNYPVLRGTFVDLNGKGLLYTRGSVPYYGTYPGLRVPRPLLLVPHEHSDSTILMLAKNVLALTKVNWNTTQFDQKLPPQSRRRARSGVFSNISNSEQRYLRISGSIRDPRYEQRDP